MDWRSPESDHAKTALLEERIGPDIIPRFLLYELGEEVAELSFDERLRLVPLFFPRKDNADDEDTYRLGGALIVERIEGTRAFQLRVERARALPLRIPVRGQDRPLMYAMHVFFRDDDKTTKSTPSIDFRSALPSSAPATLILVDGHSSTSPT